MYDLNSTQNSILTLISSMYIKSEKCLLLPRFSQVFNLLTKNIYDESSITQEHHLTPQLHQ